MRVDRAIFFAPEEFTKLRESLNIRPSTSSTRSKTTKRETSCLLKEHVQNTGDGDHLLCWLTAGQLLRSLATSTAPSDWNRELQQRYMTRIESIACSCNPN
jgi:hypothetical protein